MKPSPPFELFLFLALVVVCAVAYAVLVSKGMTWTIWLPLEAYFTG